MYTKRRSPSVRRSMTAAGCLFGALDDGEPGWRYIEVGLEP